MRLVSINLIFFCATLNLQSILTLNEGQPHWLQLAQTDVQRALTNQPIVGRAKNVIVFVGDGMGLTTITASRIYGKGETGAFAFEHFPNIGVLKTYSADKLVPDSCSTATALFCGVKANHKTAGVDASVHVDDCTASLDEDARLDSVITWAQQAGKATGFVTTTRVTHATPSALYAHTPNRNWECEAKMPRSNVQCKDIARQLVEDSPGKNINVIMGGGRQCLQSNVQGSDADPIDTWACYSEDSRDLIKDWINDKENRGSTSYSYISNNKELANLDVTNDFVLGIFANGHLKMEHERDRSSNGMPSLVNMTQKAIEVLSRNPNGFVLMVEGGLIDFAHHRGHARKALDETVAFNEAVAKGVELTQSNETLIIVTSDHSHSLVFSGYASRKNSSVLGISQKSKMDNVSYTSLLYGTGGPNNYQYTVDEDSVRVVRPDPSNEDTESFQYSQQAAVLTDEVTHGGSDVLVYAEGPMAHLFMSVHEQTYVAYVICYAAQIGPFDFNSAVYNVLSNYALWFFILFLLHKA